jgi:hypothetical protein
VLSYDHILEHDPDEEKHEHRQGKKIEQV